MAKPYTAGIPPQLDLDAGYTIRLTALDPTTGAVVTAVNVSSLVIMALNLGGTTDLAYGAFKPVLVRTQAGQ